MEGPLSPTMWLMILVASAMGAWVYFGLKPYDGHWLGRLSMFIGATSIGTIVAPGACEYFQMTSPYQHILWAFGLSMVGMPICRNVIATTESEAASWIKRAVLRVLGVKDADSPKPEDKS